MRIRWGVPVIAAGICVGPVLAHAQDYPSKPIRYIVPFGAGGPTDTQARWAAQKLNAAFGQTVIVDNRPAVGGILGTAAVAKSPPDGYTLLAGNPGPLTVAPAITANMPFDTLRDFTPVILIAKSASTLVVHPAIPAKNLQEFIALAKARPGRLNYGTPGVGTVGHLSTESFAHRTGIHVVHVPYKGGVSQYTIELMSGYIDFASLQIFNVAPFVKQGKLRALGVTSRTRSPALPDVATMHEQGLTDFENYNWNAVLAPAKTPAAVLSKIQNVLAAGIRDSRDLFINQGQEPGGESGEQLAAFLKAELERYEKVARTANIPRQ
ncbi:MAG: tripartite tricarboxylate transporter substrate binding protein [Burkholderiales bacterium]